MPFGDNKIIGRSFFDSQPADTAAKLKVAAIFSTLQGEGPWQGLSSTFIRLSHCNLACSFCFPVHKTIQTVNRGMVRMDELSVGDQLYTLDANKQLAVTTVTNNILREADGDDMVKVTWKDENGRVHSHIVTKDHPYHVKVSKTKSKYVPAGDLKPGTIIYSVAPGELQRQKIAEFAHNGAEIISVEKLSNKALARVRYTADPEQGRMMVANVSCHPFNSYIIDNLHVHNCDTSFEHGQWFGYAELKMAVASEIDKTFDEDPRRIVLTGGEPMLQAANLYDFIRNTSYMGWQYQIETNGLLYHERLVDKLHVIVISPKAPEKNGVVLPYGKPNTKMLVHADALKFVVCHPDTPKFGEVYSRVPEWHKEWASHNSNDQVYISPMNMYLREPTSERVSFWEEGLLDREANQKNHEYAAELCMKHGFRLNLQQHIYASLP